MAGLDALTDIPLLIPLHLGAELVARHLGPVDLVLGDGELATQLLERVVAHLVVVLLQRQLSVTIRVCTWY